MECPWEQQDGLEVVDNRILFNFGVILGVVYVSFWVSECLRILFFSSLFPGHFFSMSDSSCRRLGLPNHGFRKEGSAKMDLSWNTFLINFGIDFTRFPKALGAVFLVF